ncbi:UDP-N-acetylmuramoyl-L-alanine--D-glutamate ligase [Nakamurella sp. A5-74]|uniref:UDP-N-acetylmuramoylalanine--D-glutamate ligase n=1 Tax=Nakamurella sp. A5-74 TaxID=3158264 RepID=A0AAU8DLA1_9ACTN
MSDAGVSDAAGPGAAAPAGLTALPGPGDLVVAAGAGITGLPVIRFLAARRCTVLVTSDRPPPAALAEIEGDVSFAGDLTAPPHGTSLVVMSAGIAPHRPLPAAATAAGVPVVGEVELAWLVDQQDPRGARPWLAVTGTNGKTSTVEMLAAILRAAGLQATACGNVGWPLLEAVLADGPAGSDRPRQDVIAVELSSFQLHYGPSIRPRAGVVLNLAEDHLEWHGDLTSYAAAKAVALTGEIAVAVVDDAGAAALLAAAPAGRRIPVTAGDPGASGVGVRSTLGTAEVVDTALGGGTLFRVADLGASGPHQLTNAMAAATLARAVRVPAAPIAAALAAYRPGAHRAQWVFELDGVRFLDDSKATNPHAAAASLSALDAVVWIAGGQLKGASVDDLVQAVRERLVGVVLLGVDAEVIEQALRRHAPDVPRIVVSRTDDGAMGEVLDAAWAMARPAGGAPAAAVTVALAPAAASLDMFTSYGARGDAFTAAVRALADRPSRSGAGELGPVQGGSTLPGTQS